VVHGLWVDEHHPFIQIYTGDAQPPEQRRRCLGIEPMTCAPNGFRSGDGLIRLEPAQSVRTRWGIRHNPPPIGPPAAERR
jgi:aldose 1-epimerase